MEGEAAQLREEAEEREQRLLEAQRLAIAQRVDAEAVLAKREEEVRGAHALWVACEAQT